MSTFNHRRGRHIHVAGARLYTESIGPADAPTLVLLHGGFGSIEDFNDLLPALEGWRLIGIDSRGHGGSTLGEQPWTYLRAQQDVEQVLGELGIDRCSIFGFSDGGVVALRVAAAGRVAIDRLVVVGASWHNEHFASSRPAFEALTAAKWKRRFPQTYDEYLRLNPEPDFDRFATTLIKGWLDEGTSGLPNDSVIGIQAPVLVVRGDEDHLIDLAETAALCQRLPDARFLNVPFAGHVAYPGGDDVFGPVLQRFLRH